MTEEISLKINGMHCTACAMNIDGELEDTPGIVSASTNYAKGTTKVKFQADKMNKEQVKAIIEKLGYTIG